MKNINLKEGFNYIITSEFIIKAILSLLLIFTFGMIIVTIFFTQKSNILLNCDLTSAYYYTLSAIIQSNSALLGFIIVAQTFGIQLINNNLIEIRDYRFNKPLFSEIGNRLREYERLDKSLKDWLKLVYLSYLSLIIAIIMALLLMRYIPNVSSLYRIIYVEIGTIILSLIIIIKLISRIKDMHQIMQKIKIMLFEDKLKSDVKIG